MRRIPQLETDVCRGIEGVGVGGMKRCSSRYILLQHSNQIIEVFTIMHSSVSKSTVFSWCLLGKTKLI